MSYVALATESFDEVTFFYGLGLGFPVVAEWDRPNGRGKRFNLGGLRLEILDNTREQQPLQLGPAADRLHIVIEVEDIYAARESLAIHAPLPQAASWGARLFQVRDPDGIPVTFLEWDKPRSEQK
jgi:catechol 2,3-dioxygenase-like lactoylglutathione lyase family enzyme